MGNDRCWTWFGMFLATGGSGDTEARPPPGHVLPGRAPVFSSSGHSRRLMHSGCSLPVQHWDAFGSLLVSLQLPGLPESTFQGLFWQEHFKTTAQFCQDLQNLCRWSQELRFWIVFNFTCFLVLLFLFFWKCFQNIVVTLGTHWLRLLSL